MTNVHLIADPVRPVWLEMPKPPKPPTPKPPEQLPPEPQAPEPLPPDIFPVPKLPDERQANTLQE
jgi:hypothetical protein